MLNESFELNVSMESVGINRVSWHKHYKECPTNTKTFFLLVGEDGALSGLELIKDREKVRSMRKYEVSNGVSFPAFNIQPLRHAETDEAKEAVKQLKEMLKSEAGLRDETQILAQLNSLWEKSVSLWSSKETTRIQKCLQSGGLKDMLANAIDNAPEKYRALPELMKRSASSNVTDLQRSLKTLVFEHILISQDTDEWVDTLLVSTAKNLKSIKKVSLVLELTDRSFFSYPSNHSSIYSWVNKVLLEESSTRPANAVAAVRDAFGISMDERDNKETFPAVNLSVLGKVILRAMSSEIPCQKRYGRIDANSFPTGKTVRQAMKDALEWLCGSEQKERNGKTWANASGACGFTKRDGKKVPVQGLFLAYPSYLEEDPPELAGAFFRTDEAIDPDGAAFESAAERVTSALQLKVASQSDLEIRIFVLAKVDKARTKVLVSRKCYAETLISGAREWREGCKNIPLINLNLGSNQNPIWIKQAIPFPAEVVECLNVAWLQGGKRADKVHGLGIGEGIELFLGTGPSLRANVDRALSQVVVNSGPLLLALGHADHRRDSSLKLDSRYSNHWRLLPSILGLLLYKQNFKKGDYMHTAPFLVGRLLALSDLLHREYCRHVRNGDIPPQLIGNALMSSAVDNPVRGLARLRERLMIYQAWATKVHGEDFRLVKWSLKEMGAVCRELAAVDLPLRTNDSDKAQMLLGYLSRSEDKASEADNYYVHESEERVPNERSQ